MALEKLLKNAESTGPSRGEFIEKVQRLYSTYLQENKIEKFKELREATGIKVSEDIVQEAYRALFKIGKACDVYDHDEDVNGLDEIQWYSELGKLREATGIKPSDGIIEEWYSYCIEKKDLGEFDRLREAIGVEPSDKVIQKGYIHYLHSGGCFQHFFGTLRKKTGVEPSDEVVLHVQKKYRNIFCKKWLTDFEETREFTGIEPSEEVVQEGYKSHFKRVSSEEEKLDDVLFTIRKLRKETGVSPSNGVVQDAYKACIEKGQLDRFNQLRKTMQVEPSADVYKAMVKAIENMGDKK